ncbi:MAG: hypothetical protein HY901_37425 [Deltaproteobacteria bacterium]|nr:hypothetical protein [Deltaproteobacteria bacterium]
MRARTMILVLVALVGAKLALDHFGDADLFWHLRLGLETLERHELPTVVECSWTAGGAPYLANDWLAQILLALAFLAGGFPGVAVFKALLIALVAVLLFLAAESRSQGNVRASGLAVGLSLFVAAGHFIARPLLFGHLCLAAELLLLELVARGRTRAALGLPVVFALWINTHGSWPIGFGPLAATLASGFLPLRFGRLAARALPPGARSMLCLGACLSIAALFVNPIGPALVERPFALVGGNAPLDAVQEWAPVPWTDPSAWILVGLALALFLTSWRSRKPLPLFELGFAAVLLLAALRAARLHSALALVAAPLLAEQLAGIVSPRGLREERLNLAVAAVAVLLLGGVGALRLAGTAAEIRTIAPIAAVDLLRARGLEKEPGFHYFDWGGYLVFRDVPTYVDGRLEPFLGSSNIFARYLEIERKGDVTRLEGEGVRWVLARPGTPIATGVAQRPGWTRLFNDAGSELWLRE